MVNTQNRAEEQYTGGVFVYVFDLCPWYPCFVERALFVTIALHMLNLRPWRNADPLDTI